MNGPFAAAIRQAIGEAGIAQSYDGAAAASRLTPLPIATLEGDVFRGPHLVSGGGRAGVARHPRNQARDQGAARSHRGGPRGADAAGAGDGGARSDDRARRRNAIAALNAEHHKQEKAVVGHDAQLQHATDEETRLAQKAEQLAREKHQAEEERDALDRRQEEARASIGRLEERAARRPTSG